MRTLELTLGALLLALPVGSSCADPTEDKGQTVRMGPDFPSPASYYPPRARRAGQEGNAVVHVCVDSTGNLTEPPTLATSSEHASLDAAALDLAEAGSGQYLPSTKNGVAVRGCALIEVAFKLPKQPKVVLTRPGPDFPNADTYYPKEAHGHEGVARVRYCVDPSGTLTALPTITTSSGNQALDAAAINLATAASGHYLPASENGVAVPGCSEFQIAFMMRPH